MSNVYEVVSEAAEDFDDDTIAEFSDFLHNLDSNMDIDNLNVSDLWNAIVQELDNRNGESDSYEYDDDFDEDDEVDYSYIDRDED